MTTSADWVGSAAAYLQDSVCIKGPGGEAFRSPDDFLAMMERQRGRYDIKKVFVVTDEATVLFCSWYQLKGGKIASIETIFDSRAFAVG